MQNIDSDLIRGNIDTIILKTMLKEDKYGLDIIKEVSDKSSGTYELKQPTLYSCLKRLENQELISSYWVDSEIGGKRHYYKLTDKGRDFYNKKQEEWAKSKFIIDNLLSNYDYEEYRLVKKDEYDEILEQKANAPLYSADKNANALDNQLEETEERNFETQEIINDEPSPSTENSEAYDDKINENEEELENINKSNTDENETLSWSQDDIDNQKNYEQDNSLNQDNNEVFELGETSVNENFEDESEDFDYSTNSEDEDYPVYFEAKQSEQPESYQSNVSYETSDQSSNELNILSCLHAQEDEEINTYYGDQKSYVNHLRNLEDNQIEQQDLLDSSLFVDPDKVNKSINEFSDAIEKLNNFDSSSDNQQEQYQEEFEETEKDENFEIDTQNFDNSEAHEETESEEYDDFNELESLKNMSSNAFFDSDDKSSYDKINDNKTTNYEQNTSYQNDFNYEFEPETKSTLNFDEITEEIEPEPASDLDIDTPNNYNFNEISENPDLDSNNMSEIDSIIANNVTATYTEPTPLFYKTQNTNYREKLGELSKYSRVTLENEEQKPNEEALEKAKDIAEITKELEEEGIKIKEHYKQTSGKNLDRNYLLANKINLMKSLILLFGYVFILSAVYIILNNTPLKDNSWFSIKPFLVGFIPFGVILAYYLIIFIINPYKKIDAKFHFRIMLFISIIITIQLLLITYCVNLQLGFYSFAQKEYNHLYWIIPGIISFAPIIDNLIYLALFKSRNFNV